MSFANLSANLNLNIQNFAKNLQKASTLTNGFAKSLNGGINDQVKELDKNTRKWGLNLKSISQVVSGIVISKAFYSSLQSIRAATNAVWDFTTQLEYAQIAYENLFGDKALAEEFINVLEDFSAKTPFDFSQSEAAAKRLLAYGIKYKNVMYMMDGILGAATMSGDPATVERVSRAMGQIYTKGRLMNEEMRQLAEAGIPAYEILREELGLTQKQLQNLGDESIPASVALNALIDGITKRFGGVAKAAAGTLRGIVSNIKDNTLLLAKDIFQPVTDSIKQALTELGNFLFTLREVMNEAGTGGVFEKLFPPKLHETLRIFVANLKALWNNLKIIGNAALTFAGGLGLAFVKAFNAMAPVAISVMNVLARFTQLIVNNRIALGILTTALVTGAAAWALFKIQAMGAFILTSVSKVITGVARALTFLSIVIVKHPLFAFVALLATGFIAFAAASDKADNSIAKLFKRLTSFNGVDPDKVLLPSQEERANDLGKFNERLDESADSMNAMADATGKAAKAGKSLLSFDEVFKLNEKDEGVSNGIEDIDWGAVIPAWKPEDFLPEMPDFSAFATDFVDNMSMALSDKIGDISWGAIIGGALGAAIGAVFGQPILGAKIGAGAGALAGYFWDTLREKLGITDLQIVSTTIGGGIGAAIGACMGGPVGALIGAAIGALLGWVVAKIDEADLSDLTDAFTKPFKEFGNVVKETFDELVWDPIKKAFKEKNWAQLGIDIVLGIIKGILMIPGVLIGAVVAFFRSLWDSFCVVFGIHSPAKEMEPIGLNIGLGILEGFLSSAANFATGIVEFGKNIVGAVSQWFTDIKDAVSLKTTETFEKVSEGWQNIKSTISEKCGDAWSKVTTKFGEMSGTVKDKTTEIYNNVKDKFGKAASSASENSTTAETSVKEKFGNMLDNVKEKATQIWENVSENFTKVKDDITSNMTEADSEVSEGTKSLYTTFTDWIDKLKLNVFDKLLGWIDDVIQGFKDMFSAEDEASARKLSSGPKGGSTGSATLVGHARGGVFNREHVARFAEGNKAEAIIPLENASAMQPFVNAVLQGLLPQLAAATPGGGQNDLPPMYVGTLIADERGLRELNKKMRIINAQEAARRGQS